ncbi:XRE family transcriptional regulator [Thermodesulfobacteriota bacterium]
MNWELKKLIVENYKSQSDFAIAAKVSDAFVSRVINGRKKLSAKDKSRWSALLDCTVEDIFGCPEAIARNELQ